MYFVPVTLFSEWRALARGLISAHIPPAEVSFDRENQRSFLEELLAPITFTGNSLSVPKEFLRVAEFVSMHRDKGRWDLLYRILFRLASGEKHLLAVEVDPDVRQLAIFEKELRRDIHEMHAFVRFCKVTEEPETFVAWHQPDHNIVEHVAPWFARRFGAMRWSILTPDRSVHWDTHTLKFGPGVPRSAGLRQDNLEGLWRAYYQSVFNPARLNVAAMKRELPVRHWATLPEAQLIPKLVIEAAQKEKEMRDQAKDSAEPFVPHSLDLIELAQSSRACRGCDLYRHATQTVFGEGAAKARIMLVGEQPGDHEDMQGSPFVGPAGQLLDKALAAAGLERSHFYVTNAVKHFKFEERGKRRLHKKPRGSEIAACRPWLSAEIEAVEPEVIVALGATAALSVGGREFAIQRERGKLMPIAGGRQLLVTVHPSFILRVPKEMHEAEFKHFVHDLKVLSHITGPIRHGANS